jgi:hypothetical protein
MRDLTLQELAVLLATRCSYYAQSMEQLAQNSETTSIQGALTGLVQKKILQEIEGYTTDSTLGTVYVYATNQNAQCIYYRIHNLPEGEL